MSDYRDLALEHLAADEAVLREQLADMTSERDAYRDAWKVAVHHHHDLMRETESLRRQLARLRDEYRAVRHGVAA